MGEALEDWRLRNPLRQWLLRQPRGAVRRVMTAAGVGRSAVYAWVAGTGRPSPKHAEAVRLLTRVGPGRWRRWRKEEPRGAVPCDDSASTTTSSGSTPAAASTT